MISVISEDDSGGEAEEDISDTNQCVAVSGGSPRRGSFVPDAAVSAALRSDLLVRRGQI